MLNRVKDLFSLRGKTIKVATLNHEGSPSEVALVFNDDTFLHVQAWDEGDGAFVTFDKELDLLISDTGFLVEAGIVTHEEVLKARVSYDVRIVGRAGVEKWKAKLAAMQADITLIEGELLRATTK